jgi:hypothetical protein
VSAPSDARAAQWEYILGQVQGDEFMKENIASFRYSIEVQAASMQYLSHVGIRTTADTVGVTLKAKFKSRTLYVTCKHRLQCDEMHGCNYSN